MSVNMDKSAERALLDEADQKALFLIRDRVVPMAAGLAPQMNLTTGWPSGNRQGPRGNLGRSVRGSDMRRGVYGNYIEISADYYAVFLRSAGQIRDHSDFLNEAKDSARGIL